MLREHKFKRFSYDGCDQMAYNYGPHGVERRRIMLSAFSRSELRIMSNSGKPECKFLYLYTVAFQFSRHEPSIGSLYWL
jgi:hypothetical protein